MRSIHVTTLTADDALTADVDSRIVVWAARPYDTCPGCGEEVEQNAGVPVHLDGGSGERGGTIVPYSMTHGCGRQLWEQWVELDGDASRADIEAARVQVARMVDEEREQLRAPVREQLQRDLRYALARLGEPLDAHDTPEQRREEVTSGDEAHPGVHWSAGEGWVAWGFDPCGELDYIQVTEADLSAVADA